MLTSSTRLGPYEITAALGAGGMGEVYRARDTRLGREVAIKVLPEHLGQDPERRGRFEREARAVAALSHPNILAIHDYGTHGPIAYAVTELLEGETLRARLAQGALPWREIVQIGAAIAEGLAAAHARGIIHRDLKPENLFLTRDGQLKILDFGLAHVEPESGGADETRSPLDTRAGMVMGTLGYMSPEQVRGQPTDGRSDLFSLGCVLYEMTTGQRAFHADGSAETMTAILRDEPPDVPDAIGHSPSALRQTIRRCLQKKPELRYPSARDLAADLRGILGQSSPAISTPRRWGIMAAVVASMLIIGVGAWFAIDRLGHRIGSAAPISGEIQALAVLPFKNLGGEAQTEPLCDGLADHLINSLSQARRQNLKVRPFNSISHYKGTLPPLGQVGRELNVGGVLTGTLHQQGDDLTISVALVDVREENQLWGKRYQAKVSGILKVQDQIFADVTAQLRLTLTPEEQRRLARLQPQNHRAYILYNEGMFHLRKFTEPAQVTAREYFQRALEEDKAYALAYVGMAQSHLLVGNLYRGPRATYPEARKHLDEALALDESLAHAHALLGMMHTNQYEWLAAEREFKRALALDPDLPPEGMYGFYLGARGRLEEALKAFERAVNQSPQSAPAVGQLGLGYLWLRQPDQAITYMQSALQIDSNFYLSAGDMGRAYLLKGMHKEALDTLQLAVEKSRRHARMLGLLGYGLALSGKRPEAEAVLAELTRDGERYSYPMAIARVHAGLGQSEQAIDWLEKAMEERDSAMIWVKVDETLDSLRGHSRFHRLLRQMGLEESISSQEDGIRSVAVLPFENVGADPKNEYLSDGLADHIINSLWQVRSRDLKVRPFTSVARYRGQKANLPQVARDLNVRAIITGTLHQQEENLWISVALMDALDDNHLWGKRYQGTRSGILELQDQIARDVAENLRLRLTRVEQQRLTRRHTENHEAYLLFREGMHHHQRFSQEGLTTAISYFERALRKDPNYALAHVGIARCYILLGTLYLGPRGTYPEAQRHLEMAIKIDDSIGDIYSGLGGISINNWDWDAAESMYKRAIELDSQAPTHSMYGYLLAARGRTKEALSQFQQAQLIDPVSAPRRSELAKCYIWLRQPDKAMAEAQRALELDPSFLLAHDHLALAYVQKGMYDNAIATLGNAIRISGGHPRLAGNLGYAYAAARRPDDARKVAQHLLINPRFGVPLALTRIYASLGEMDPAFEWLEKAMDERDPAIIFLKVDVTLDPLHSDPRFDKLLQTMGLPKGD